jgi:hypothetical protein
MFLLVRAELALQHKTLLAPFVFGRNLQCQPVRVNTQKECHWIACMAGATNPAQMVLAVEKLGADHFEMLFSP